MSKRTGILIGAIAGDIIGSMFEFHPCKSEIFDLFTEKCRFTDDTVLTLAIADAILKNKEYQTSILIYAQRYPGRGYGSSFKRWITSSNPQPYNSYGNGSAMRVSPVGWIKNSIEDTLKEALASAIITHNHSEGLKGAQSIALAIYLARNGETKGVIREQIMNYFGYNLNQTIADILPDYQFDETCQGSVPQSLIVFLQADSYEDTIRKAISLGGDADTMACIAGSIAEAWYGSVPENIVTETRKRLPQEFLNVIDEFNEKYG